MSSYDSCGDTRLESFTRCAYEPKICIVTFANTHRNCGVGKKTFIREPEIERYNISFNKLPRLAWYAVDNFFIYRDTNNIFLMIIKAMAYSESPCKKAITGG